MKTRRLKGTEARACRAQGSKDASLEKCAPRAQGTGGARARSEPGRDAKPQGRNASPYPPVLASREKTAPRPRGRSESSVKKDRPLDLLEIGW